MFKMKYTINKRFTIGFVLVLISAVLVGCSASPSSAVQSSGGQSQPDAGTNPNNPTTDDGGTTNNGVDQVNDQPVQPAGGNSTYSMVDTGQVKCYNDQTEISCPEEGEAYYGQDGTYSSNQLAYVDNGDGTITDLNTGLMWIQDPGDKMTYYDAIASANSYSFAGYNDWRVPTIKELYSLMDFSGIHGGITGVEPFIDTDYFVFEYGDTSIGEREIDSQWVTTSVYEASVMDGQECFFGVNFADGRIKCYGTSSGRIEKLYFLRLVRGGDSFVDNQYVSNGNGTLTDQSTGLVWQQADSGEGMDWGDALDYCESLNLAGQDDWRLPNAKELQYIIDYTRSPDTTNSAAIDPIFSVSGIVNEAGQNDFPFYWTSTTHISNRGGQSAVYVAFGRALGYFNGSWTDVHGAGAQRSDPKSGDPADYPSYFGPQGDVSRLLNYVRCVRAGSSGSEFIGEEVTSNSQNSQSGEQNSGQVPSDQTGTGQQTGGQAPGGNQQQSGPPQINLAAAAETLGVTELELKNALGDPTQGPPDFDAAAVILGVTVEELIEALGIPPGGPGQGGGPSPGGQVP